MDKITLLINGSKELETEILRQKIKKFHSAEKIEMLSIVYQNSAESIPPEHELFLVADHEDVSLTKLLAAIQTEYFLFFDPKLNYPVDFFDRFFSNEEADEQRVKGNVWEESIVALQQSHYGLCGNKMKTSQQTEAFLSEAVLFNKKEVEALNTDKVDVHPDLAAELYRYAEKKNLNLMRYSPKKEKVHYHKTFPDLMLACKQKAQKHFVIFPAIFVLFFLIFGIGAYFHPVFMLIFLFGMSVYLLAITLESFGLSTIKKNGAILIVLLFLFPFVHLVYGLESWMAKFQKKA